jgi:hypothetical protein
MPRVEVPVEGTPLKRLSEDLAHADPAVMAEFYRSYDAMRKRGLVPYMVAQVGGLKIRICADEHPPPHFHVEYQGESASFSILSCERLPGVVGLERHEKVIRRWFRGNQDLLVERWNTARPTNCPVGPITLPMTGASRGTRGYLAPRGDDLLLRASKRPVLRPTHTREGRR